MELTILSPHRDDAAFSLYLSLAKWSRLSICVRIVNFFTLSAYAPRLGSEDRSIVSAARRKEDHYVLRTLSKSIKIESLDLLDAPLRFGISAGAVCGTEANNSQRPREIDCLTIQTKTYSKRGLVIAPLSLGNHIDHAAVNTAAARGITGRKLGFYEDLPYATWTAESSIRKRVSEMEERTGGPLKPFVIRVTNAIQLKRRAISRYHSQISPDEASRIAQFALKYGGGERIWIPKRGSRWKPLTQ